MKRTYFSMVKSLFFLFAFTCSALLAPTQAKAQSQTVIVPSAGSAITDPSRILALVEANQVYGTISYEGGMEIHSGTKIKVKTMKATGSGGDKAFIEFTNPEDKGVRMLKLGDNLWMYFPKERDTVKISGALLRQGMMGSDLSYEEAMEPEDISDAYSPTLSDIVTLGDSKAYVLELVSKNQDTSYGKRRLWIDAERFIILKSESYGRSGLLLKTTRTLAWMKLGERYFPSSVEIADAIRKNSRTIFTMTRIYIDAKIDESVFSLQALSR